MEQLLWGLGIVCMVVSVLPPMIYLCVKAARLAYLNANRQFDDQQHQQEK